MEADGETRGAKTHAALIARGKALAATEPNYARFLLYTVRSLDPDDLGPYSAAVVDSELRRAYALLERRGNDSHFIQASTPDVLVLDAPEIIDIFAPDMPFIVDSVLAAIRSKGGHIRLVAHPVLPLDPQSYRVLNEPTPQSRQESFLHLHIDPLPDEAARAAILREVAEVLDEVARVVRGWRPMLERLRQLVQDVRENPPPIDPKLLAETIQFLGWLAAHNFTFLGLREYAVNTVEGEQRLEPVAASGVGLLEDQSFLFLKQGGELVESTRGHRAFLAGPDLLVVAKANVRSRVHRRTYMDYVGIKLFDAKGAVSGEIRLLGLFTSRSAGVPTAEVPLLRRKLAAVLERSGTVPDSHAGKALLQALESYPREELFQVDEDELLEFASTIASLTDRPRVRVLPRIDRFDNYVSVLVFLLRDRYDSAQRQRIGDYLSQRYGGHVAAYSPYFPEGELVRVHFIIGRLGGPTPRPDREDLERDITALTRDFGDRLMDAAAEPKDVEAFRAAFPPGYQASTSPAQALGDIEIFRGLGNGVALHLVPPRSGEANLSLRVYHRETPLPLSDRVPLLENFGFRVIDEQTNRITPEGEAECFLHEMVLALPAGVRLPDGVAIARVEEALLAVWHGQAESDGFNALSLGAGLAWDAVAVLRALSRFLGQVGTSFSQRYIAATLTAHPAAAGALVELFQALHAPDLPGDRRRAIEAARSALSAALEQTASLDEDRIISRLLNALDAVVRTNFYQRDGLGGRRPALGFKFDSARVEGMPAPAPFREIFVYSPQVEAVHLRFGAVARGGIRWSDRREDFRAEALGLARVQQVKNAIIVPVGAKGAFLAKTLPAGGEGDAIRAEAVACYRIFISTLLDLTDNIVAGNVVPPPSLVRYDGDDPYLVVAADKGTADFSDIANALAIERGFWLGDAFAAGGADGYDHKRLGITARGAWEAVKRHFREQGRDIQATPFTVAGVGDMSGDVFGNGMLLSPKSRLVAAFDHRDIFIDPDPDPAMSFAERQRLFNQQQSSWQDYNHMVLSAGGGVYSRSLKSIELSEQARGVLGLVAGELTPDEVIVAILKADVDLLWFGGIGTFVRGAGESHAEVGDRANDAIRITGGALRAKVVGEGANLAVTQRGRIDYARRGGRIDTDAIDNSAGVNCSDLEVNLKIALDPAVSAHRLSPEQRNELLRGASGDVLGLCIRNNYLQSLALSVGVASGGAGLADLRWLVSTLETRGLVDRDAETLPSDTEFDTRATASQGLLRPELAALLGHAKIALRVDLLASPALDDPYLQREVAAYFPSRVVETQPDLIEGHRLKREIVATVLANAMLNRGGAAFATTLMAASSADAGSVARAFVATRDAFGLSDLYRRIDALDGKVDPALQLELYGGLGALLLRQSLWFIRNERLDAGLGELVPRYALGVADISQGLLSDLPPSLAGRWSERARTLEVGGVPADLAQTMGRLPAIGLAGEAVAVAARAGVDVVGAARTFLAVLDLFGLGTLAEASTEAGSTDRFERLALDRALANLLRAVREVSVDVLASGGGSAEDRLALWQRAHRPAVDRTKTAIAPLVGGPLDVSRLSVAAGLLSDLASGQ